MCYNNEVKAMKEKVASAEYEREGCYKLEASYTEPW